MLSSLLARHNNDQLTDLALLHPPAQLAHNLLHVRLHLVVTRSHHIETIFLHCGEIFGRIDSALEENGVAGEVEELYDRLGAAFKRELVCFGSVGCGSG